MPEVGDGLGDHGAGLPSAVDNQYREHGRGNSKGKERTGMQPGNRESAASQTTVGFIEYARTGQ